MSLTPQSLQKSALATAIGSRQCQHEGLQSPLDSKPGSLPVCKLNGPGASLNEDLKKEIPDKHRSELSSEVEEKFGKWTRTI